MHLELSCGKFEFNVQNQNGMSNEDKTHIMVDMDNVKTSGFAGRISVNCMDVVSEEEDYTMTIPLGGDSNAPIMTHFMIFRNKERNYPICGVPNNINWFSHRTGPKICMDSNFMTEHFSELKVIGALLNERKRIHFIENCGGHILTSWLLEDVRKTNTGITFFPPSYTTLFQPCNSVVIQKLKCLWSNLWKTFKKEKIRNAEWFDCSRNVLNSRKRFLLFLAALCARKVNAQRDTNEPTFARKAVLFNFYG